MKMTGQDARQRQRTLRQTSAPTQKESNSRKHGAALHPSWCALIELCERLDYGEIDKLKIQDGLPVLAEMTTQKIKLT